MMILYHVNHDRHPQEARDLRSPMTDEMIALIDAGAAGTSRVRDLEAAERLRIAAHLYAIGGYDEVAHIEGDDPEFAYKVTQNGVVSESWSRQPPAGVAPVEPSYHLYNGTRYGRKSTDIGDLIKMADGRLLMVDTFGFTEVGNVN